MKRILGLKVYQDDRLIIRWVEDRGVMYFPKIYSQTKRLPNNASEFVRKIQKEYRKGTPKAIAFIREQKALTLRESVDMLNDILKGKLTIE